jgi:ribosome-binding protein aMBF1 (putative translation factor)
MLNIKDLLEYAERCRTLADLSRLPQVSQRLRVLAQRYAEQARDIKRQRAAEAMLDNEKTNPVREALNVRRLRVAAGLSQAELADRMGVDRAYVSGLELGQRNPTIVTLWHIAKALGVKLRLFFNEGKPGRRTR